MRTIKAIETKYNGVYYRSRLEARWAIWFDAMKITFDYEKQGWDLGDGIWYLPDFHIPDWKCHIEIKPSHMDEEDSKRIGQLSQRWEYDNLGHLVLIAGDPSFGKYKASFLDTRKVQYTDQGVLREVEEGGEVFVFGDCYGCDGVCYNQESPYISYGQFGSHPIACDSQPAIDDGNRIMKAYDKAMHYKFDHKEGVQ